MEEILYPAMEDYELDLVIGEGPSARSVRIDLSRFTLIGATTRTGLLTTPLRDRFGIPMRLDFYSVPELEEIVRRGARLLSLPLTQRARTRSPAGARHAADRGAPAHAGARLRRRGRRRRRRCQDRRRARLTRLEVDDRGLDALDRRYLALIAENSAAGRWASRPSPPRWREARDAIEEIVEPYLMQQGFIARTPRGRMLTQSAFGHLGLQAPDRPAQFGLFNGGDE